jgi:hypothetical protein
MKERKAKVWKVCSYSGKYEQTYKLESIGRAVKK